MRVVYSYSLCELPGGTETELCEYDLGAPGVAFKGDIAVFLENYDNSSSGEVRVMEIKNIKIKPENGSKWTAILDGVFSQNYEYTGSYNYGSSKDTFWIITSGVPGKSRPKRNMHLTVKNSN